MNYIDYSFAGSGRTLALECRLADGWRKHTKTYCFSESVSIDWKLDSKCYVVVSVFPRPGGFSEATQQWPLVVLSNGQVYGIDYSVKAGKLEVRVPLLIPPPAEMKEVLSDGSIPNVALPWGQTEDGKLRVHIQEREFAFHEGISYELQFLWTLLHKPLGPGPRMIEWCRRFYPGGLPTLGKRR
jgi:hypothetical protein